ncbi:MAG: DUF6785 family protein [Armatimonadota bacterium]
MKYHNFRNYRAVILGALLVPFNVFFLVYMEFVRSGAAGEGFGPYPSTVSLFANTIFFLVILTVLNALVARRYSSIALARSELLIIYVMLVVSTAVASLDFIDVLMPMITHAFRFATPENRWQAIIWPHIPEFISVRDPNALKGWYEGHMSFFDWQNLSPWLIPTAVWTVVIMLMLMVMYCINTVVRQQWVQNEKLLFPIIELPMQVTEPDHKLLKNRLMWAGFCIAAGISLLNGLHLFWPNLPMITVKIRDMSPFFPQKPWNAIGWTPISFYPYAIGLGFLLPVDMLFSCWFFYLMWKIIRVLGAVYGAYDSVPAFPYMNQQALGSYYFIAIFAIWIGRTHLRRVWRIAIGKEVDPDESQGPMRYRTAFLGIIVGTALLAWFSHMINMSWWFAVVGMCLYFFLAFAIAKMHAEFGPPAHDMHFIGPEAIFVGMLGPAAFNQAELTGMNWFWWFNRAYRSIPIAYQLDGMKIGQKVNLSQRRLGCAMGIASLLAVISAFTAIIYFGYKIGASSGMGYSAIGFGYEAFQRLGGWINTPAKPDIAGTVAIGWGTLVTYFLYAMRIRFGWWPLHPLGFAISTSWSIGTLWLPLMIAWAAKILTMKFGGLRLYKIYLNFFLGLILGDFIMGCLWPIIGWILGVSTYGFMQ